MPLDPLTTDPHLQRFVAGGVLVGSLLAAFTFYLVTRFITRKYLTGASGRSYRLAHSIMRATSRPGALFLLILGAMIALLLWPDAEPWHDEITTIGGAALVIVGAVAVSNVFMAVANWYSLTIAISTRTNLDDRMLPVVRRVIPLSVYAIGGLIVLDMLGISISPLLGGLGITGLAVALALQPTLSNFFAGTNVLSEGAFSNGDYIELQGGPAGYVQSVGFRSTRIRTWLNNDVIIPNSVLSSSIMVNYSRPDPRMNILVTCGVSYDSDLQRVNDIALEVAREAIAANPEAEREEPWFGFERFGDSNIDFWVFLQARDRVGSFIVTNDLIKRLHARFKQEGIEINYPVRKVVFDSPPPPSAPPGSAGP
ncbi:MAG: mechanosensitive ion channel [Chloroflexota bacterium]|nr:mechanosensitive ion channel [Chloroflexota bacterium]MDE2886062.1 mechanosensitive ion channel [Chloroflexota bacterium]